MFTNPRSLPSGPGKERCNGCWPHSSAGLLKSWCRISWIRSTGRFPPQRWPVSANFWTQRKPSTRPCQMMLSTDWLVEAAWRATFLLGPAADGPCSCCRTAPRHGLRPREAWSWPTNNSISTSAISSSHGCRDPCFASTGGTRWHTGLKRQFHAESEALCDGAAVARSGQSARQYVEFLMSLRAGRLPALSAGMAMKPRIGQRIERLLLHPPRPAQWRAAALAILLLALLANAAISLRIVPNDSTPQEAMTGLSESTRLPGAPKTGTETVSTPSAAAPLSKTPETS